MKDSFRQSMALFHSWVGLLPGWLLFVIFLFGTTAFFQHEINAWMRPELLPGRVSRQGLEAADRILRERGAGAQSWSLTFPEMRGGDGLTVEWLPQGAGRRGGMDVVLDPATGREVTVRETRGGYFLYRFHFDLHYMPVAWARYIVSVAALAMLVAILSGVVTHKKIFADFFLLRFGKGQRSWLDAHNVTGVLALPFFLMITYTGLVTLMFMLMPWAISATFPSEDAFYEAAYPEPKASPDDTAHAAVLPVPRLVSIAERHWQGRAPSYISVERPGMMSATATLYPSRREWRDPATPLHLNAVTGAVSPVAENQGSASATREVMVDLHRGWFARPILRWFYFLSGIGGTVIVATGLVLWTVKRRVKLADPTRPHFGFRLVERLNIGVIVGSAIGIAVYFLANRLLPVGMPHRADWEVNALFVAWGAAAIWATARPTRRAWIETLLIGAALYALIPVVNAVATERGTFASLLAGDWVFVGFDLVVIATSGACALAAYRVAHHKARTPTRRRQMASFGATA
ncbi:PepSY-associated TM helix domain-containing protein [Sphingomonas sp.]|uniref:PepSY-associated TM helix domain-containing protein n=1 Tax=Sphingomonas sp. TaxID=28214 RepID=UPI0031E2D6F0